MNDSLGGARSHEISIGRRILVLIAWWREILVGAALVTVVVSGAVLAKRLFLPTYEAFADVTIVRTMTNVSIDNTLETAREFTGGLTARMAARRAALVGLVHNASVARAVIERLRDRLDDKEVQAAILLERIDSELVVALNATRRQGSDLIRIIASSDSPDKTAAIATAWAEEYVSHVNRLYEQVPESLTVSISEELKRARQDYQDAQKNLEKFISSNNIDQMTRLIEEKRSIVRQLTDLWRESIDSQLSKLEVEQQAATAVFNERTESLIAMLSLEYEKQRQLDRLLADARSLRTQIETGGEASVASNGLALMLLKAGAYASSVGPASALDIRVDGTASHIDAASQLADVKALIVALEAQYEVLEFSIERLSKDLPEQYSRGATSNPLWNPEHVRELNGRIKEADSNEVSRITAVLEDEVQELLAEREARMAMHQTLVEDRNIKRSALTTLQNESVELRIGSSADTPEVRLASPAAVPVDPAGIPLLLIVILAGGAGLPAAACTALLAAAVNVQPLFARMRKQSSRVGVAS